MRGPALFCAVVAFAPMAFAQQLRSPEVHDDGGVTFRLASKTAESVSLRINGATHPMEQKEEGIFQTTLELPSGIHDYTFVVDGTQVLDLFNRNVKKWRQLASMVEVPADPPALTEEQYVPHGVVHRHLYDSTTTGAQRPLMIYTPPGYASSPNAAYPVVYLLHGNGDDETAWTEVGRAHFIIDNMIAAGTIRPMIVAMPYGHPVPSPNGERSRDYWEKNQGAMADDLVNSVLPFVEKHYRARPDSTARAIVGLSMGGGQSLDIGLKHTDKFAWIGAFSAAAPRGDLADQYPAAKGPEPSVNRNLKLLWVACGKDDFLLKINTDFIAELDKNNIQHKWVESDGGHSWNVWRVYLPQFLDLVFE